MVKSHSAHPYYLTIIDRCMNLWLQIFHIHPSRSILFGSLQLQRNYSYKVSSAYQGVTTSVGRVSLFFQWRLPQFFLNYFFQRTWIISQFSKFSYPSRFLFFFPSFTICSYFFHIDQVTTSGGRVLLFFQWLLPVFSKLFFSKNLDNFSIFKIFIPFKIPFFFLSFTICSYFFHIGRLII